MVDDNKKRSAAGKRMKDDRVLLLMDDCMSSKGKWLKDDNILELFFNGSNLTNATDINRFRGSTIINNNDPSLSLEQYYGKTFDLGFRYSF